MTDWAISHMFLLGLWLRYMDIFLLNLKLKGPRLLHAAFDLLPTVKMAATCSSETSIDFKRTTRRNIAENRTVLSKSGSQTVLVRNARFSSRLMKFSGPILRLYCHCVTAVSIQILPTDHSLSPSHSSRCYVTRSLEITLLNDIRRSQWPRGLRHEPS
jgi:hypothetical protein